MTKNTNTITATINPRKRIDTTIIIVLYAVLAIFSAVMGFFDLATDRNLFGVLFLIAAAIFSVLLLIKGNAVFGTYLKIRSDVLYMKSWANGFLPYDVNGGFLSDLKPSKTNIITIPADEISTILVGTKDFIKRNMTEAGRDFIKALYPYEHSSKKSKKPLPTQARRPFTFQEISRMGEPPCDLLWSIITNGYKDCKSFLRKSNIL